MRNTRGGLGLFLVSVLAFATLGGVIASPVLAAPQRLKVSSNGRFLVTQDNRPFFWMGDTNWRLYKLNTWDINRYLDDRAAKGFNVIQGPVLLHVLNGIEDQTPEGYVCHNPNNPSEQYFQRIDYIVNAAAARNMYVALVCTWGDHLSHFGSNVTQQRASARAFGRYVGNRYRNHTNVVFIVAGEYNILGNTANARQVWTALAGGLKTGSGGNTLITIHASYQAQHQSSSVMFQDAGWLAFNMIQSSQSGHWGSGANNWQLVLSDWQLSPVKPVMDGEAHYEGIGGWDDFGVRRRAYWSVFAGAFGHTYGANGVWQSYRGGGDAVYYGSTTLWYDAMNYPGAGDMKHLRRLMESRPMLRRIPADGMLMTPSGGVPDHIIATRDQPGRYAMVYVPDPNRTFTVNVNALSGTTIKAWWYDCRTGAVKNGGQFAKAGAGGFRTFTTPNTGQDWVLVLDDKARGFPKPGVGGPRP